MAKARHYRFWRQVDARRRAAPASTTVQESSEAQVGVVERHDNRSHDPPMATSAELVAHALVMGTEEVKGHVLWGEGWTFDEESGAVEFPGGGGTTSFFGLTEVVPEDFTGAESFLVSVNPEGDGLVFVDGALLYAAVDHDHDGEYLTQGEADVLYAAIGHNHTGVYSPVGHNHAGVYDPAGTGTSEAAAAVAAHVALSDPHTQYLTQAEGDILYSASTHNHGTGASGRVSYFNGTSTFTGTDDFFWHAGDARLGLGTTSPQTRLQARVSGTASIPGTSNALIDTDLQDSDILSVYNTSNSGVYAGINLRVRTTGGSSWTIANQHSGTNYLGDLVLLARTGLAASVQAARFTYNNQLLLAPASVTIGSNTYLQVQQTVDNSLFALFRNLSNGTSARAAILIHNDTASGVSLQVTSTTYTGVTGWSNRAVMDVATGITGGLLVRVAAGGFQVSTTGTNNQDLYVDAAGEVSTRLGLTVGADLTVSGGNATIVGSGATGGQLRLENNDVSVAIGEEFGRVEWYANDASTGGTGISGYIANKAVNAGVTSSLSFGVRTDSSGNAYERMILDLSGLNVYAFTGPTLRLSRDDASVVLHDTIGKVEFWGNDSDLTTQQVFGSIEVQAGRTIDSDAPTGKMLFRTGGLTTGVAPVDSLALGCVKTLTDAATQLFDVTLAAGQMAGGFIFWTILATDGTDMQSYSGITSFAVVNKAGTYTSQVTQNASNEAKAVSGGTLTASFNVLNGSSKVTIRVTPSGSLTETTYRIRYAVQSNSPQAITIL